MIAAQSPNRDQIVQLLEKEDCVTLPQRKVRVCKYVYVWNRNRMEGISIRPLAEGKFPGLLLLAGRSPAQNFINFGLIFAEQGFACLSVSDPGFGKSEGKPDFVGPDSLNALAEGFEKLRREPFVDSNRMGIFGYSRGGMGASLLTIRLGNKVSAAVFGAGIYDFKREYDETGLDGIRENMKNETGMTARAIEDRSSILGMEKLMSPVLIIHGENDVNVPTNQALLLRDRLIKLKKDFEIKILNNHKHGEFRSDFILPVVDFLSRRLKGVASDSTLN